MENTFKLNDDQAVLAGLTGKDIVTLGIIQDANDDAEYENELYRAAVILKQRLDLSQKVVIAAHRIDDFVPDLNNQDYRDFWNDLLPILTNIIEQDTKTYTLTSDGIGSIPSLAVILQKASDILQQTHASDQAAEIAKRNVSNASRNLESFLDEIGSLENTAIDLSKLNKIFEMIGPEPTKFVEDKAKLQTRLVELNNEKQSIMVELSGKQGELARCSNSMSAIEKQLKGVEEEMEATKARIEELRKLNEEVNKIIDSLPTCDVDDKKCEKDREKQIKYYESIILARNERIKDELKEEEAEQKIVDELLDNFNACKAKYEKLKNELETLTKAANKRIPEIEQEVDEISKKIQDADAIQNKFEKMIGLQGKALIECLTAITTFRCWIKYDALVFAPLLNIFKIIQSIVESNLQLLEGISRDICLAALRLQESSSMLMRFHERTKELLETSDDYKKAIKNSFLD